MTYSNRGGDRSRSTFYGKPSFSDRGSDRPAMHDAICAKCGTACRVPFVPNGRKEVFCSKCFGEMNGGERDSRNSDRFERSNTRPPRLYDRRESGSNFAEKQLFEAVCEECGNRCQVPFRPSNGKPVLCSNCFAASKSDSGRSFASTSGVDLAVINAKLDKILKLLTPPIKNDFNTEMTEKILEEIRDNSEISLTDTKKKTTKKPRKSKV